MKFALALALALALAGCAQVERARLAVDAGTAVVREVNTQALVQADIERKRLRALRCMDPLLTPDALAAAANEPMLGPPWVDELLKDCPQFAGFIGDLAMRRLGQLQQLQRDGLIR